jgi:hypothetical protein
MFVRIADNVTYPGQGGDLLRSALRVTSSDNNLTIRIFPMDTADSGARVLIGSGGDRTSVENNDLCGLRGRRAVQPSLRKLPFNGCAVSLCRTAAKILDVETSHTYILA